MKVTTKSSKQIWQSPDKQKTIWEVTLKAEDGKLYGGLKTYSESIAKEGFEGEVETYDGKNPGEKFVKQPNTGRGGGNNAERLKADAEKQKEIKAEWAIAKAISSLQIFPLDDDALAQVEELATKLYQMVNRVKETQ